MFDTLAYAKKLQEVGFTKVQAETLVEDSRDFIGENLVTKTDVALIQRDIEQVRAELKRDIVELKRDIEQVRAELKQDIEQVRAELKQDIEQVRVELKRDMAELKAELLKWVVGLLMAQTAILITVFRVLPL